MEERVRLPITLESPVQDLLGGFCAENRKTEPLVMAKQGSYQGKTLALCGAGPSLADYSNINGVDYVFAANSALPYLTAKGQHVDAGIGIDQTPGLLREWLDPPDVPYFLASTVDPELVRHLKDFGRDILFFHSLVGFPYEVEAYKKWPTGFMVFSGRNVVGRFLAVANWLGFESVDIYGADHAFRSDDIAHADGTTADEAYDGNVLVMSGEIDGRMWHTRADMLVAAVDLARQARDSGGRIRLIGDTLPNALIDKDDEFLDQVCRQLEPGEEVPN
jgi:hypothetical protein